MTSKGELLLKEVGQSAKGSAIQISLTSFTLYRKEKR
jgi:hypothetical protein